MRSAGLAIVLCACALDRAPAPPPVASLGGSSPLVEEFARAAAETGTSPARLAAIAYARTRLAEDDLFALTPAEVARAGIYDDSIRAAATLLAADPDHFGSVDALLARGIDAHDALGRAVIVTAAQPVAQVEGYPAAQWVPASTSNYQVAARGVGDIDHIVIHDTEGSFGGSVEWFQNPAAQVSAHYIVRSSDGAIDQMVEEQNIAWHDACFNTTTIGIEHEGYAAHPDLWFTEAMYASSAALTAYLCDKYGIAKEHGPILGHGEAPDCSDHTDPGAGWDWDHYIDLVQTGGAPSFAADGAVVDAPAAMVAGELATVTVRIANRGNAAWDLDLTRVGTAEPTDRASELFVEGDWLAPNRATGLDARVAPGQDGVFSFQIRAPLVTAPTLVDEAFQLVEEGTGYFGSEFRVTVQVAPALTDDGGGGGGCAAGGGAGSLGSCGMLLAGVALSARLATRRRARPSGARRIDGW